MTANRSVAPPRRGCSWWRLWSAQASFAPGRQQWLGWIVCLAPWLRSSRTPQQIEDWLQAESDAVNTNPYLFGLLVGVRQRVEEEDGEEMGRRVTPALSSALGALGDTLTWTAARPFAVLLALCLLALGVERGLVGALLVWALFFVAQALLRRWAIVTGLTRGLDVIEDLQRSWLRRMAEGLRRACVVLAVLGTVLWFGRVVSSAVVADDAALMAVLAALLVGSNAAMRRWRGEWALVGTAILIVGIARAMA